MRGAKYNWNDVTYFPGSYSGDDSKSSPDWNFRLNTDYFICSIRGKEVE